MFNYPQTITPVVKSAEQFCSSCSNWFPLTDAAIRQMNRDGKQVKTNGVPSRRIKCSNCKAVQFIIPVGKYDRPGTPKSKCACQYVILESMEVKNKFHALPSVECVLGSIKKSKRLKD